MVCTRTGRSTRKLSVESIKQIVLAEPESEADEQPTAVEPQVSDPESLSDDDDVPMEVSSKNVIKPDIILAEPEEEYVSIYDMVKQKKEDELEKGQVRKSKKRDKKKARKLAKGTFEVKQRNAKFQVMTLKEGIKQPLEPKFDFRDELLKSRTENVRMKNRGARAHREKWISARV